MVQNEPGSHGIHQGTGEDRRRDEDLPGDHPGPHKVGFPGNGEEAEDIHFFLVITVHLSFKKIPSIIVIWKIITLNKLKN